MKVSALGTVISGIVFAVLGVLLAEYFSTLPIQYMPRVTSLPEDEFIFSIVGFFVGVLVYYLGSIVLGAIFYNPKIPESLQKFRDAEKKARTEERRREKQKRKVKGTSAMYDGRQVYKGKEEPEETEEEDIGLDEEDAELKGAESSAVTDAEDEGEE